MLHPLRLVNQTMKTTPVLTKAVVMMNDHFACDCSNCRDTVGFGQGVGPTVIHGGLQKRKICIEYLKIFL